MLRRALPRAWVCLCPLPPPAEEGVGPFIRGPADAIERAPGSPPAAAGLDRARLSSVRFANGCSASFVSADGLVMTNHHCVHECVEQLSGKAKDLVKDGFVTKSRAEEKACPGLEANQLVRITDVTKELLAAVAGKEGKAYADAQKAEKARLEKACAKGDQVRCDVVSLYDGGRYDLYEYRRFQDVRLVFAPELAIAFFGGDPDNFMFPRFDLDSAFVRVYEGGEPLDSKLHHFPFGGATLAAGDAVFVSGHPGGTSRQLAISELEYQRDVALPRRLFWLSELRGLLTEYGHRGVEQKRHSTGLLFGVENSLKALKGMHKALLDRAFFAQKIGEEKELLARAGKDPKQKLEAERALAEIGKAVAAQRRLQLLYGSIAGRRTYGLSGELFGHARMLVRAADELRKPNGERLKEFGDANLPALQQELESAAPLHAEFEIALLTFSLTKLREELGPDHPLVKKVLGREAPGTLAARVVKGSTLADPKVRAALYKGGTAAVEASKDPMIALATLVDPEARAVRRQFEEEIEAASNKAHEALAKVRFAAYGSSIYPDATFTLRLAFGRVAGWEDPDFGPIAPFTTIGGAFDRHTGEAPFALPQSWLKAKGRLDAKLPLNFSTNNDIIGGNSGSPVVNRDGRVVGLIFDGNLHSLGGEYGFDPALNRAVAVDARAIEHALHVVYGADALVKELTAGR